MTENIQNEIYTLVRLFITGCILAMIYDVFRILRRVISHNAIAMGVQDVIFWLFTSVVTYYTLITVNSGNFRVYFVIGLVAGVVVYLLLLSRLLIKILTKIILKIVEIARYILKKLVKLFKIKKVERKHQSKEHRGDFIEK